MEKQCLMHNYIIIVYNHCYFIHFPYIASGTGTWILSFSTHILSSDLSMPYAKAAAVGSLITRRTFNPAIWPASLVAYGKGNGAFSIIGTCRGDHVKNLRTT